MELHERFMKFAGAESSIFNIIGNSPVLQQSIHSVIGEYLENCFGKLKANDICQKDLEFLRLFLCQLYKFYYEHAKNDCIKLSIEFNQLVDFFKNGDICKDKGNQSILCDVMVLYMILLVDHRNLVYILEDFQNNYTKTQDRNKWSTNIYLKLLNCFLSSWEILNFLYQEKDLGVTNETHLKSYKKVLLSSILCDVPTLVKCNEHADLQLVLSKIISLSQSTKILSLYIDEMLEKNVALGTLCAISNFIFSINSLNSNLDYCLIYNSNLLKIIQNNLYIECPQKRKEARFLLNKLIDFIDSNEETLRGKNLESYVQSISYAINPFICDKTKSSYLPIKQVRTNFILVLEALEEKQKHLVAPCLPLVETLINAVSEHRSCGNCFDISWLYCVFTRILKHYNSAIVKWGLLKIIKLPIAYSSDSFLLLIITTLNNTFLYEKTCNQNNLNISSALTTWFIDLQNNINSQLIEKFLYHSSSVQWSPVPIFYVLQSLFYASLEFNNILQWEEESMHTIKLLVSQNIILHPPMLRSMSHVQLIQILCNTSKINDMKNLINFITVFPEEDLKESACVISLKLCLAKIEYSEVVKFVKSICDGIKTHDHQVIISMSIFSLVIQLLYEGEIICQTNKQCSVTQELKALLLCLDKIDVRPYIKLSLITKIIAFINGFFSWGYEPPHCVKITFDCYKATVFKFILKLFHNEILEYQDIEIYDKTLRDIFNISNMSAYSQELEMKCIQVLCNAAEHSSAQILFALRSWSNISHNYKYDDKIFLQKMKDILAVGKSQQHCSEITGIAGSDFYTSISKLVKNHLSTLNSGDLKVNNDWLDISSFILDAAGNQVLIYLSDVVKTYSTVFLENTNKLEEFKLLIKSFWNCIFGNKREKIFWLVTQKLTECINRIEFLQNQSLYDVSKEFSDRMLKEGESLSSLKYILLTCSDLTRNFNHFTEVLLNGLLHGQVLRRDQRIHMQACMTGKEILSHYELKDDKFENFKAHEFLNRQCNVDVAVRAAAVIQLCKALDDNKENANVLLPFILQKLSSIQSKRYFADSQLHRLKHRIMQTLLILQPHLNKKSTGILYHMLLDSIIRDTDQHSVRLMREWLLIRIYLSNVELFPDLWLFFDKICDERPNSVSSLIGIVWHIARQLSNESFEKFICTALPKLSICCMGQQFGMRLFGQVFFIKIYELLDKDSNIRKEHVNLYNATLTSMSWGNLKKSPIKKDEDFFYTVFNPELHYSLETIYHQLPRLFNVSFEEFITREDFQQQIFLTKSIIKIRVDNCDNFLDNAVIPYFILKSSENSKPEEIESSNIIFNDVQKKITPWRMMLPNEDEVDQNSFSLLSKIKHTKDIIVVASLVDKPQNLGGIARTCEIFGAKAYILPTYLMELKNNGWTLVGAEQTANSVNLIDYSFAKQTILVLGNEKNGIPANIIPLLDVCVEIPQYGIIRSLNVHVTSAICIWEYNKQHQVDS
ncbi:uncharacterized protein LOC131670013 isoform X2 [Phymastichus coffea]|uniref:uncharacterized protein LOC131670013 isoform X2 n=1 Tax=Phymastichus coffea TaxID=108790 RepID=UPI00273CD6E8|nr:uncharacterized protein LOC131670013 isoform X2 [Phymastichus coffea]